MKTHLLRVAFCFCIFAFAAPVIGGEYYIYRDRKGVLVITNKKPPAGTKILKKETFPDSVDSKPLRSSEEQRPADRTESSKNPRG